jgi:citrate lyase beta subunit
VSQPHPSAEYERSPEQAARENALREVSETLLNIEQAARRAKQARQAAAMTVGCEDLAQVLGAAEQRLEEVRKDLFQSAYFAGDRPRLF